MNKKGFILFPVLFGAAASFVVASILTYESVPSAIDSTQYNTFTSEYVPTEIQGKQAQEIQAPGSDYAEEDPLVDCEFKSETIKVRRSVCGGMVDCQVGDKWVPATKDQCAEVQGKLANLARDSMRRSIEDQYRQALLDGFSSPQTGSAVDFYAVSPSTPTPSQTPEINVFGAADSYTRYGNTVYGSDGSSYTQYGNTVYGNDGSSYTQYGNTIYGDDGSTYTNYGNTTYGSDGTSYTQYGNTTYGSDGSSYSQYGNTIYTNP